MRRSRGYTLIELLIAIFMLAMSGVALYVVYLLIMILRKFAA